MKMEIACTYKRGGLGLRRGMVFQSDALLISAKLKKNSHDFFVTHLFRTKFISDNNLD